MEEIFIESEIVKRLSGRSLFYPAAGCDWGELLGSFEDYIDEFRFSDISYNFDRNLISPFTEPASYRLVNLEISGEQRVSMEERRTDDDLPYKFLKPGQLTEVFERSKDRKNIKIIRRRGFGQYALTEIEDGSLGIFVHRGDSPGEGGSNIWFLSDWRCSYPPCGSLFAKISRKLADRALIVSDGSNTRFKFLRKHHGSSISSADAFAERSEQTFKLHGFEWTCAGYLTRKNGPTLVWSVVRTEPLVLQPGIVS